MLTAVTFIEVGREVSNCRTHHLSIFVKNNNLFKYKYEVIFFYKVTNVSRTGAVSDFLF